MGQFCFCVQNSSHLIMKVLLLVALAFAAVVAEPEAEANADAGYYGLGYYGYPYRYGYYGYPYRYGYYGHYLGKRISLRQSIRLWTIPSSSKPLLCRPLPGQKG